MQDIDTFEHLDEYITDLKNLDLPKTKYKDQEQLKKEIQKVHKKFASKRKKVNAKAAAVFNKGSKKR